MINRCENENNLSYKHYGGRGIKVCEKWHDFDSFYNDVLKVGYDKELQMDRIDNNGNYEPNNIRFVTSKEQNNNKRNNHIVSTRDGYKTVSMCADETGIKRSTMSLRVSKWSNIDDICNNVNYRELKKIRISYNGEVKTIKEWAMHFGIDSELLRSRIKTGRTLEEAINFSDKRKPVYFSYNGETMTIGQWAKRTGLDQMTIRHRLKKGASIKEALSSEKFKRTELT